MSSNLVYIKKRSTQELVPAILLTRVTIKQVEITQIAWQKVLDEAIEELRAKGLTKDLPEHHGWNWRTKHKKYGRKAAYRFLGIECEQKIQGLMLLNTIYRPSHISNQKEKQIIYGMFLESAPWNISGIVNSPKYSLVGSVLLAAAVRISEEEECEGRIGLHSLKQSENFYKDCGMTDLGIDQLNENKLRYFELTTSAAKAFLARR